MKIFRTFLFLLLLQCGWAQPMEDGFYSVVRQEALESSSTQLEEGQHLNPYGPSFLNDDEEPVNVVVESDDFVPLTLKEQPSKRPDTTERTQFWLGVQLTDQAAVKFEGFTRDHLGGTVAIVVGGKVVTMHRIKDVIKGGNIQISRCGDAGCQILFRELRDNVDQ